MYIRIGIAVVGMIIAVVMLFGSWFRVAEGERGVYLRNGGFISVEEPGLGFKWPIIDKVVDIEIRNMSMTFPVNVYSADTQQYDAEVTVNYEILPSDVEYIFKREGMDYAVRRLRPLAITEMKEVSGKFSARRTIQERDIFGTQIKDAVAFAAAPYRITVTELQVRDIQFTPLFIAAVEAAATAKAEVERKKQELIQAQVDAEKLVVQATAQADKTRAEAIGSADAVRLTARAEAERITLAGLAEAKAIAAKAKALRADPALIEYTRALAALQWDGRLPVTFVPGSALPIVDVGGTSILKKVRNVTANAPAIQ